MSLSLPVRQALILAGFCLVVSICSAGCAAIEIFEAGAAEMATGAGVASAVDLAAVAEAIDAGAIFRALPEGGLELEAEGAFGSGTLRQSLEGLAARSGTTLEVESGAIVFGRSRLVITEEGLIGLRSSGSFQELGRLSGGAIYETNPYDLTTHQIGQLQGIGRAETKILSSRDTPAVVRQVLGPGRHVEVLQVREGWYEVRLSPAQTGWVPVGDLLVSVALAAMPPPLPGPWHDRRNNKVSEAELFVLNSYERARCEYSTHLNLDCFNRRFHSEVLLEQHPGLTSHATDGHMVRLVWASDAAAVVEIQQSYVGMLTNKPELECETVLLERPSPQASTSTEWKLVKRGTIWTCGEQNIYLIPFRRPR